MRHLFLTGDIQVGKSTLLQNFLTKHPHLRVGGFQTVWSAPRLSEQNTLHLVPALQKVPLTEENCVGIRDHKTHFKADFPAVYDRIGTAVLLGAEDCDLILMDELGPGEDAAEVFRETVKNRLAGDIPVFGVIRQRAGILPELVRTHPDVTCLSVTEENRGTLLPFIETFAAELFRGTKPDKE